MTCSLTSLSAQGDEEVIIYVDASKSSNGGNSDFTEMHTYGKSWNTAFRYLHDALRYGDPNATQIWIAKGNYYVDRGVGVEGQETSSSAGSFYLNPFVVSNRNLKIYGGFAGTETSLTDRDIENNPTYLDGNVYYKGVYNFPDQDNLYARTNHFARRILVVHNSTLTLDGLIFQYVKGGDSTAGDSSLKDTERNSGQGAFILANQSALTINNCLFQYGLLGLSGLMVYATNNSAPVRISNSRFTHSGNTVNFIQVLDGDEKVIVENTVIEDLERNGGKQVKFVFLVILMISNLEIACFIRTII